MPYFGVGNILSLKYCIMDGCFIQTKGAPKMNLVEVKNNQAVTSSRQVAESFGKQHKHVLNSIREILVAENSATKFFCRRIGMIKPLVTLGVDIYSL